MSVNHQYLETLHFYAICYNYKVQKTNLREFRVHLDWISEEKMLISLSELYF